MKRRAGSKPTSYDAAQFLTLYLEYFGNTQGGATVTPIQVTPDTPTSLIATALSSASIGLVWSSTGENTRNFLIERSDDSGVTYAQIATVDVSATIYTDIGLTASTQYYYRVRASNDSTYSPYSNVANATTLVAMFATILDDFNRADGALGASWTDDPICSDGLHIYSQQAGAPVAYSGSYWNTSFGPDCEVFVTVATLPLNGESIGLECRYDTAIGKYQYVGFQRAGATFNWSMLNHEAPYTPFKTGTLAIAAGGAVGIRMIGAIISLYYKAPAGSWVLVDSGTDPDPLTGAGKIEIYSSGTTAQLDDFGGGTI